MPSKPSAFLLPLIVFAQFAGTSLWFAGNAILPVSSNDGMADITSVVQFGFIAGTLVFSIFTIADRFGSAYVFFISATIAAAANILLIGAFGDLFWMYTLRFITGFFLAGIYPVGMKIAADHFPGKLGTALGFLVGALVLGTAFPHLVRSRLAIFDWQQVLVFTSMLAFGGGCLILLFARNKRMTKPGKWVPGTAFHLFRSSNFKGAAFGYFGHMWELYAFWAFVPFIISLFNQKNGFDLPVYLWTFLVIAFGAIGCITGGWLSRKYGSRNVVFISLFISAACCLLSPLLFFLPSLLFLLLLLTWGFTVVADSPQFSTMVAQLAPAENKGTALTIVTCVGFAITIASIQLLKLTTLIGKEYGLLVLFPGPLLGLMALRKYVTVKKE